ncbi:glycoside hydrolase family 76 protein [Prevotella sp. FD3004]|uniref:glycoside hydrolase family 76 protein n=1 Tax=Prevotella sp. FD3004 TaxID=1408309 RepID=UPI0018CEB523|nr:glycoside hydrolase family 76 protein [Prevotella sp. FD3004]MCR5471187.1 glycoside hydrolase family 76 protein [Prevotella sp.]
MKKGILTMASLVIAITTTASCGSNNDILPDSPNTPVTPQPVENNDISVRNLTRATILFDAAMQHYISGEMKMADMYNPSTDKPSGEADVWPYTAAIEACNSILEGYSSLTKAGKKPEQGTASEYKAQLEKLYDGLEYYAGTFKLTSYTLNNQEWTVYGVHRGSMKGGARVDGDQNVYDDQQWIIRELLRSWKATGEQKYLDKAEYLTAYVLDGWDWCLDDKQNTWGNEVGGITWGPSYCTKHACSNGPFISPLVWLAEYYQGKSDKITYRTISADGKRQDITSTKADYYLMMAKKIYEWQQYNLRASDGIYLDMVGANNNIRYEVVDGVQYRISNPGTGAGGTKHTYNSGTMVSGGADLYSLTHDTRYLDDTRKLYNDTFSYFPKKNSKGNWDYAYSNFSRWFDDVLMRGWISAGEIGVDTKEGIETFQTNLDYAWDNFLLNKTLPRGLTGGWSNNDAQNDVRALVAFAYASEYGMLVSSVLQ